MPLNPRRVSKKRKCWKCGEVVDHHRVITKWNKDWCRYQRPFGKSVAPVKHLVFKGKHWKPCPASRLPN